MHRIEHGGKTYTARKFDRGMNKVWASRLAGKYRSIAAYDHEAGETTEAEYRAELAAVRDLYFAGEFRLLSERGTAAMLTEEGVVALVELIFGLDSEAEVVALMTAREQEVGEAIRTVLKESFPEATFREPDPNAPRPPAGWIDPRRPKTPPVAVANQT